MLRWSIKSLFAEPVSLIVSTIGLAVALFLVLFLEGMFVGESRQIVRYLNQSGADIWVMQDGVSNMHMATSVMSDSVPYRLRNIEGVAEATPILYLNSLVDVGDGSDWFSYIVGVADNAPRGGPWAMKSGSSHPKVGEVVIPSVLAKKGGFPLEMEFPFSIIATGSSASVKKRFPWLIP